VRCQHGGGGRGALGGPPRPLRVPVRMTRPYSTIERFVRGGARERARLWRQPLHMHHQLTRWGRAAAGASCARSHWAVAFSMLPTPILAPCLPGPTRRGRRRCSLSEATAHGTMQRAPAREEECVGSRGIDEVAAPRRRPLRRLVFPGRGGAAVRLCASRWCRCPGPGFHRLAHSTVVAVLSRAGAPLRCPGTTPRAPLGRHSRRRAVAGM
jgi:hypothetical protein